MRVFVRTYGCTYNQADSEALQRALQVAGISPSSEKEADVVIVNTCGVKDNTEKKVLYYVEHCPKPVVVTGCIPQADSRIIERIRPDAVLLGVRAQDKVVDAVEAAFQKRRASFQKGRVVGGASVDGIVARIRICDGCLGSCTYCFTRLARTGLKSVPVPILLTQVHGAVANGAREIRFTAQDAGCYGKDFGGSLAALLHAVSELEGRFLVRVGMTNPQHCDADLWRAFSAKTFAFAHLPVQSGSDSVLEHMGRPYSVNDFKQAVNEYRSIVGGSLATDLIVGYPTETEGDFEASLKLVEEIGFDVVNVSKYGRRPGTIAARLKPLPSRTVKERSTALAEVVRQKSLELNERLVGAVFDAVIVERGRKGVVARTTAYKPVVLPAGEIGEFVRVRVTGAEPTHLFGETAPE
ncbi:threonylcarbamoyladenosine tRNA methylthiotransferase [Candidatus Micrarchaeota archaeon CG_4_10_14_0_2_um_filter_55_9]|nr:MAG: hypothetical protein AUJ15_02430 [Candidatus Micrarchaeota archaeon CG1_02_55_41]PIO03853.1 MAG: threonylcarbamoyladenosine tRNA methylthiotransferase [Candidatus Micrarchaeota archaeon CG09_land_8_20_14_0_10_55_25]PIZ91575.1 MAG: threonylcarbamoyladenosine tRNA methylthiotransferase [Candidatus Micrarchaeota archaeon CG_4_10_14_0_2_um_filter_55_9]PJD00996.1 MAG: threonylcarbamoyladenosine tRNA methylthiotransferase [Candidatus Micrarchaeota archaeon CG10_big_fil_rev_8_21_14_0_10_54_18]